MYCQRNHYGGYGLINQGIQLFLPLNSKICLCIYDNNIYDCYKSENNNIVINHSKEIDTLNKLIYLNSFNTIFFSEKMKKSYIMDKLSPIPYNKADDVTVLGNQDEKLIIYHPIIVNKRFNITFFKVKKEYLFIKLPNHMEGLVRKGAKEVSKHCEIEFEKLVNNLEKKSK